MSSTLASGSRREVRVSVVTTSRHRYICNLYSNPSRDFAVERIFIISATMATARNAPTSTRNPKRPKLNAGQETNINDLVNFQLPPRRHAAVLGPRRGKRTVAISTPWARERAYYSKTSNNLLSMNLFLIYYLRFY